LISLKYFLSETIQITYFTEIFYYVNQKISINATESFEESEEIDLKTQNELEQQNKGHGMSNIKVITKKLSSSQNCLNEIKKDVGFSLQVGKYQVNELKRKSQADLLSHAGSNLSCSLFNLATESSTNFSDIDGFDMRKISMINQSELNGTTFNLS
jgi:hypothetical protein